MQPDQPDLSDKNRLLEEALLTIRQTLQKEFAVIPVEARKELLKTTLRVYERLLRFAQKKKLNLPAFANRVLREQAHVWLLRQGSEREQQTAENWVWKKSEAALTRFIARNAFRTNDVVADIVLRTMQDFYRNMRRLKPLDTLLELYLVSMARLKVRQHFRDEQQLDSNKQRVYFQPIEQTFVEVDDAEFGSMTIPVPIVEEEDDNPYVIVEKEQEFTVTMKEIRQFLNDCLENTLGEQRQELIRLRYKFLTQSNLDTMTIDEVSELMDKKFSSQEIAEKTGYKNERTVNSRMHENITRLHKCIMKKVQASLSTSVKPAKNTDEANDNG